jgi:magnesium-transporting ATPase (P-type)
MSANHGNSGAELMTEQIVPHALPLEQALEEMETHLHHGLSSQEARARLERYGPNELQERPRPGFLKLLLDQFNNFLIIILIVAAVVSLLLGETIDALAILAIVVLNATLGVIQESKAEQALAALTRMAPRASWCPATSCCWRPGITCRPICGWWRAST